MAEVHVGTCRCGEVRVEVSAPPVLTSACHCTGCRKMTASAFSLSVMFPAQAFRVATGAPVKGGANGPDLDHMFCPSCMTWMYTRIAGLPDLVNVRAPLFDDPAWNTPYLETMTDEKLPWATTPARQSFAGFPGPQDFQPLLEGFAAQQGAPT